MPFEYKPFVNPYIGSISELMGKGDEAKAQALLRIGDIQARESEKRGEIYGNAIQNVGNVAGKAITDWRQEKIDAPIRKQEAELRDLKIQSERRDATQDALSARTRDMFNTYMADPTLWNEDGLSVDGFLALYPGADATIARTLINDMKEARRAETQAGHDEAARIDNVLANTADSILRGIEDHPAGEGDPEDSLRRSLLALGDLKRTGTISDEQVEAFIQGNANHAGGTLGFLKEISYGGTEGRARLVADESAATRVEEAKRLREFEAAQQDKDIAAQKL
jgi:hypothetical protein